MTTDQLAEGIRACIRGAGRINKDQIGWPPTLPEFRLMCAPDKPVTAAHHLYLALSSPRSSAETAARSITAMYAALGRVGGVQVVRPSEYALLNGDRDLV